jgi:hypothetical protein
LLLLPDANRRGSTRDARAASDQNRASSDRATKDRFYDFPTFRILRRFSDSPDFEKIGSAHRKIKGLDQFKEPFSSQKPLERKPSRRKFFLPPDGLGVSPADSSPSNSSVTRMRD